MTYRANTVRYLDNKNNKSLIQFNDEYDSNGILKKLSFSFIGVGSSSGLSKDYIYDFDNLTINNKLFCVDDRPGTIEELKEHVLNLFNKNPKLTLICPKDDCNDPNCRPHLSIGNKITQSENTKQPYFSSNCNGINYGESELHLNAKINIHKLLMEKAAFYAKNNKNTKIENLEIEKTFSVGNGQERRADVYYEKHFKNKNGEVVVEKFAIEVQRSNIKYDELTERTNWYKDNGIATFWIVVSEIFDNKKETIDILSKKDFGLPLLSLISFSMANYNNRFFIYDNNKKKIIPLTVQQENIESFNTTDEQEKKNIKTKFSTDNLFIISNTKEDDKNYKLLSYKQNRNNFNIGVDLLSFGIFSDSKNIVHKVWSDNNKKYEYAHFIKLGNSIMQNSNLNLNNKKSKQAYH